MKVVCESCQAKYQVPDERVAGKKLKIRCKRCSATVLIRGDLVGSAVGTVGESIPPSAAASQHAQAALATGVISASIVPLALDSEPPPAPDAPDAQDQELNEQEWHVSLDGDTRGPFGIAQLRAWLSSTPGGWEAHVWRDGFHDWMEARACTELEPPALPPALGRYSGHADLGQSSGSASFANQGNQGNQANQANQASHYRNGGGYGHGASGPAGSRASQSQGAAAYDDGAMGAGFQANVGESSPFFADHAGNGAGVMDGFQSGSRRNTSLALGAAQASARPRSFGSEFGDSGGAGSLSDRHDRDRSDDSVLFSTSSLQNMTSSAAPAPMPAPVPAPAPAPAPAYVPGPNPGFASGEGSGLIDIRALASLARQSNAHIAAGAGGAGAGAAGGYAGGPARPTARNSGEAAGLSFGNDEHARSSSASLSSAYARVDSLAPVSHVQTSNAALPLAILGGCALVAAAVLAAVLFTRSARPAETASAATQDAPAAASQPRGMHESPGETALPAELDGKNSEQPRVLDDDVPDGREQAMGSGTNEEDELAAKSKRQQRPPHSATEEKKNGASPEEKAKPKKEEKPEPADSSEVMLAERAKPAKPATQPGQPNQQAVQGPAALPSQPNQPKASNADVDDLLGAKPTPTQKTTASVDDLLAGMDKAPAANKPAAATATKDDSSADGASGLPDQPSRDEVLAAMRGVEAAVRACPGSEPISGTADVSLLISGTTGRVASATVTGITGGVGSCIARAVRNARFPHFTRSTISIKYPYRF